MSQGGYYCAMDNILRQLCPLSYDYRRFMNLFRDKLHQPESKMSIKFDFCCHSDSAVNS